MSTEYSFVTKCSCLITSIVFLAAALSCSGKEAAVHARSPDIGYHYPRAEVDDGARYLTVVENSQQGKVAQARDILLSLLKEDLPRYSERWRNSDVLQPLRETEYANEIDQHIDALAARWRDTIVQGLPVLRWRAPGVSGDPFQRAAPQLLRAGMYLPEASRFVPLGPHTTNAIAVLHLPTRQQILVVYGVRYPGLSSGLDEVKVQLYDAVSADAIGLAVRSPHGYEGPQALELASDARGVYMRAINDVASYPDKPLVSDWQVVSGVAAIDGLKPKLRVMAEGSILGIPEATAMSLSPIILAQTEAAWRVSLEMGCTWNSGDQPKSILQYSIHHHQQAIAEGAGGASIMVSTQGQLLVQTGQRVSQYPPNARTLEHGKALPEGLVLTDPLVEKECFDL